MKTGFHVFPHLEENTFIVQAVATVDQILFLLLSTCLLTSRPYAGAQDIELLRRNVPRSSDRSLELWFLGFH